MKTNAVKQALREGKIQLGTGIGQLRSTEIPRILAAAGFHWAFIDTEHGSFDLETVQDLCRASVTCGLSPMVRVGDLQYTLVARVLDSGAQGVIFPRVESPELLTQAISWAKFPPVGIRGYGLTAAHYDYEKVTFPQVIEHMNSNTLVVMQMESRLAVDLREELLSTPGLDAIMIGPSDLSISLGVPGEFEHPTVIKAIESIRDTCLRQGVIPGIQTRSVSLAKFWKERGMLFLGCMNETALIYDRAADVTAQLST